MNFLGGLDLSTREGGGIRAAETEESEGPFILILRHVETISSGGKTLKQARRNIQTLAALRTGSMQAAVLSLPGAAAL